jgi:hypothetical protein
MGFVPMHAPAWHDEACVQALLSLHTAPSTMGGLLHTPVAGLQMPAMWHWSEAVQTTGFDPVHVPFWHVSVCVQEFPSPEQAVPFALFGFVHAPVAGWQTPGSWHSSSAVHWIGFEPVQTPIWQLLAWVHGLLSLHTVPSGAEGLSHPPVAGSQVPGVWHSSVPLQLTGSAPTQAPATQVSLRVHRLPSVHVAPSVLFGLLQTPVAGSHVPGSWHWSSAVQTMGLLPVQAPATHVSVCVQASPSLHVAPSTLFGLLHTPVVGSQAPTS